MALTVNKIATERNNLNFNVKTNNVDPFRNRARIPRVSKLLPINLELTTYTKKNPKYINIFCVEIEP